MREHAWIRVQPQSPDVCYFAECARCGAVAVLSLGQEDPEKDILDVLGVHEDCDVQVVCEVMGA